MKALVGICRIFVGILFIISGFIKLNDPIGFSYKLQDYFAEDVLNLVALKPYALGLAVFIVIFEVLVGVFLLLGTYVKFTIYSLLGMIVFFTFLTFYSAYFNKVTDCGCFGDALPLTPWQSFYKDLVLLVLIIVLLLGQKHITTFFKKFTNVLVIFLSFIASLWYTNHVLMHLPGIDFRAYKKGVNIQEGMSTPEDAPKAKFKYHWVFEENGTEKKITTNGSYPKTTGKFVRYETEEIQKGYEPPIHDFSIDKEGEDITEAVLNKEKLIVIVSYKIDKANKKGLSKLKALQQRAEKEGYTVIGLSGSLQEQLKEAQLEYQIPFDFYATDMTALKTMIRANPGIIHLEKGTIIQKLHWNDAENLQLN